MPEAIVQTRQGKIAGTHQQGCRRWLGIPYARAERFGLPEPVAPWTAERSATAFGRQCSQQFGRKVRAASVEAEGFGEDCLYLNVWTPDGGKAEPKPVMVWIHGGAFVAGGADTYEGWQLACEGDVVVVTINYRLGVFGFVNFGEALGLPAIPSNLGLRDQIAALEWVRDNIAAFGGDPEKVTIFGESAGSMSVSLLMLSPLARGLFHGAIMQSGAVSLIHDRDRSISDARRYAEVLDLDQSGFEKLRSLSTMELLQAQVRVGAMVEPGIPAAPWYDGDVLPASLAEARAQEMAPVPLIAGATREEIRLFRILPGNILPTKRADLEHLIRKQLDGAHAERILEQYPRTKAGEIALGTDLTFLMPTRNFATRHAGRQPTWFYRFDYANPIFGAAHAMDLGVFWPMTGLRALIVRGGPNTGRRKALGERMRRHWAHFAHHGTPGSDWPGLSDAGQHVRSYGLADEILDNPDAVRFAAWAGADVKSRIGL
ncbi:carboxylesterase/lipase family protein [Novosphingobium album (ex Hu et al. 2023)]|uniref:Carboxylic ester hydrolase n=1 Tax=Novosphingobium album (ex Hu et al. 2023) TaxID=2930093 RepID=A0ABT0B353_9SPHN|nr:carboxylesterase family protein [Novosphingobium album (ex Hu et al. 2023)]MCJ2179340.1 carboxylesterase family protein [Novosphingobium album (ex Hu et al. 2023)]